MIVGAAVKSITAAKADGFILKEGVQSIGTLNVVTSSKLTIPSSVNTISKLNATSIDELIITDHDTPLNISNVSLGSNKFTSIYIGRDIDESSTFTLAGAGASGLESVIIGDKVTKINDNMFNKCTSLRSCVMGENVKHIGSSAFEGCTGLDILSIGESVETIGMDAYKDCTGFSRIVARGLTPPSGSTGFGIDVEDNVPLFVPEESMDDYMNSDLFLAFADIESQTGKIVEEVATDGEIDQEFTIGSQIKIPDWLKFIFRLVGHVTGHNSPAKAPARAEAETADPAIRWFAPNPNIASVDQDGVVTINGEGDIEIWAYALDGSDKKAVININRKTTLAGDVNGDGELTASDVNAIILHILLPDGNPVDINTADLSGDGQITVSDVNNLIERILNK